MSAKGIDDRGLGAALGRNQKFLLKKQDSARLQHRGDDGEDTGNRRLTTATGDRLDSSLAGGPRTISLVSPKWSLSAAVHSAACREHQEARSQETKATQGEAGIAPRVPHGVQLEPERENVKRATPRE
jgi:hypothetical protein